MNKATARNIRVQNRYDELMTIGSHGHYETMFRIVQEEVELAEASRDAEIATLKKLKQSWHDMFWESEQERNQLRRKVWMLQNAIKNLRDVKGRHHSEIAYKRLIETLIATEPKE